MTTLSPALDAAYRAPQVLAFGCIEIVAPSGPIRLLDGSGSITFDQKTFVGRDPVYGVLASMTSFADGVDGEAPSLTITLLPATNTGAAALAAPAMQGAQVSVWAGAASPTTGQVLGEPDLAFIGQVDVPTLKIPGQTGGMRTVEITVTAWDFMFADDEGVRLSDPWHQSIHPGDTSLAGVTSVLLHQPWGANAPRPSITMAGTAGTGASGGGGFGGGIVGGAGGLIQQAI